MASFKNRGGRWTAEVRIKGVYLAETFETENAARAWALTQENRIRLSTKGIDPSDQFSGFDAYDFLNWIKEQREKGTADGEILQELCVVLSFLVGRGRKTSKFNTENNDLLA